MKKFREKVYVSTMGKGNVRKYFLCITRAMYCEPDDPNLYEMCRLFSCGPSLGRHIINIHMTKVADGDSFRWNALCAGLFFWTLTIF